MNLLVLHNMSVAGVRVVEFGTNENAADVKSAKQAEPGRAGPGRIIQADQCTGLTGAFVM